MKKSIIITAGATYQPIDRVRVITNISSGKTGCLLSDALSEIFNIKLILSKSSIYLPQSRKVKILSFDTFDSLNLLLKNELSSSFYDAVIHLAAVSDYTPYLLITESGKHIKLPINSKISVNEEFMIKFKKNFKILDRIKEYSQNKNIKIIAFKLTSNAGEKQAQIAVKKLKADAVIHNDTSAITEKKHQFNIYINYQKVKTLYNTRTLARYITEKIILKEV